VEINGKITFERQCKTWHIRVYRAADGTAIIERIRGAKSTKPAAWTSDRTPEEWVGLQRDASKYNIVQGD
jgi:hypothetical protein